MNDDTEPQNSKRVNLWYLMINFLKIGSTSFGGHMALISVVQDQMVKRDEIIDDDTILNGISLATILPGPFAMNVVTFIGYKLLGFRGAMVSLAAITIPSFALVLLLSIIYFNYQDELITSDILKGILPAVSAIVLSVAIGMTKKISEMVSK